MTARKWVQWKTDGHTSRVHYEDELFGFQTLCGLYIRDYLPQRKFISADQPPIPGTRVCQHCADRAFYEDHNLGGK